MSNTIMSKDFIEERRTKQKFNIKHNQSGCVGWDNKKGVYL